MQSRTFVLVAAALAGAGVVHVLDSLAVPETCPLAEGGTARTVAALQDEPVDFLFAPAIVWRRLALQQDLEALARRE